MLGRTVVLGVCGGIAAYKAVEVCRRLVDAGAHLAVVMTESAQRFVGPMTFSALASEPVATTLWDLGDPLAHTRLAARADCVVVAPATADFIARYAQGMAGDMLCATLLASTCPVVVCPAMHTGMWEHPATRDNIALLARRGVTIVDPGIGRLAGGDIGAGRLAEPEEIAATVRTLLAEGVRITGGHPSGDLAGHRVLVTAGGTREPIDPVRFIGNRSSGKQGHAIAAEAAARGAQVCLVTTANPAGMPPGMEVVGVETAADMADAVLGRLEDFDLVIMAAAVADFRPESALPAKHKKIEGPPEVSLVPTIDILAEIGVRRPAGQVVVGFAAETGVDRERVRAKMLAKGADLIVANDVSATGVGFGHDTNAVWILGTDGTDIEVPLTSKTKVAQAVLDAATRRLGRSQANS